ncbi:hypothetical protein AB4086_02290 [Vibrio splendidus]
MKLYLTMGNDDNDKPLSYTASFVGSEGLDSTLGLDDSTKASPSTGKRVFVQYNKKAKHSTIIGPQADLSDAVHTVSMRAQVTDFLKSDSLDTAAPSALLK